MKKCCADFCITKPGDRGNHHHKMCDGYRQEKNPYLFYLDEGLDAWVPVTSEIDGIICASNIDDGERVEIHFKRIDMTDEEFDAMPED